MFKFFTSVSKLLTTTADLKYWRQHNITSVTSVDVLWQSGLMSVLKANKWWTRSIASLIYCFASSLIWVNEESLSGQKKQSEDVTIQHTDDDSSKIVLCYCFVERSGHNISSVIYRIQSIRIVADFVTSAVSYRCPKNKYNIVSCEITAASCRLWRLDLPVLQTQLLLTHAGVQINDVEQLLVPLS